MLPDPAPIVHLYPGMDNLSCSASGTPNIYVAIIENSTVIVNTTKTAELGFYEEGKKYSCVATSKYGTDTRVMSVKIIGKNVFVFLLDLSKTTIFRLSKPFTRDRNRRRRHLVIRALDF